MSILACALTSCRGSTRASNSVSFFTSILQSAFSRSQILLASLSHHKESLAATSYPGSLSLLSLVVQKRERGIEVVHAAKQLLTTRGLCEYEKDSG